MIRLPGSSERLDLPLAVVVGAGGMGMAIARRLGRDYRLLLADVDGERVQALAADLRAEGHDAAAQQCDIGDAASVAALAERAGAWCALAHVAALSPSHGDWATIMRVNLLGTLHVEQAFHAKARQGSAAVFISSLAAHSGPLDPELAAIIDRGPVPGLVEAIEAHVPEPTPAAAYALSKTAMNRLCMRRAAAWGMKGARIVSLSPGLIATPMGAREFLHSPKKMGMYEKSPLQREGTMLEVAEATAFLLSPAASFISGTDLLVDGGLKGALLHP